MSRIRSGTNAYDSTPSDSGRDPNLVRDVGKAVTIFVEGKFQGKKGDSQKAVQFIDEQIKNTKTS